MIIGQSLRTVNPHQITYNSRKKTLHSSTTDSSDGTFISPEAPNYSGEVQQFKLSLSNESHLLKPGSLYTLGRRKKGDYYIPVLEGLKGDSGISGEQITAILMGTDRAPYMQIEHVPASKNKDRVQVSLDSSEKFQTFSQTQLPKLAIGDRVRFFPIDSEPITFALTIKPEFINPFGLTDQIFQEKNDLINTSSAGLLAIQHGNLSNQTFAERFQELVNSLSDENGSSERKLIEEMKLRINILSNESRSKRDALDLWIEGLSFMAEGFQSTAARSFFMAKKYAAISENSIYSAAASRMNLRCYLTKVL
ncbi:MAG: hypothetical protein SFU25_07230 [Candidatus Caenarcaniphilales bacterium]|nr:hypothetical protein [Candidatus Caenarcaniphilales bacterium]